MYDLTLTFKLTNYNKPLDPEVAVALNRVIKYWSDGRRLLDVENLMASLNRCIENAVYQVFQKAAREQYGNQLVPTSKTGKTSKAHIEANKEFDEFRKTVGMPGVWSAPDVKIEREA